MKFTDGFWMLRHGVTAHSARETYRISTTPTGIRAVVATKVIAHRGDTLGLPTLTVSLSSPAEGVVRVRIDHFRGRPDVTRFVGPLEIDDVVIHESDEAVSLTTGSLTARVQRGAPWSLAFELDGQPIVSSGHNSIAHLTLAGDADVDAHPAPIAASYVRERLSLDVGELIFGLGERFGPVVRNGQRVDVWNADGGTASEQAYKNVPFYVSNRGYGVLVNDPGPVSFEIGSEAVGSVQFSAPGESLEYFVIAGPTPAEVIDRYTRLTGRPTTVPAWSYGLWLSTSFTTDYDEETVTSFVAGMADRGIPLSVFHFDCFWMRGFSWTDFTWDPDVFPDPEGMLARLRDRGLRVCVWINPYIAQDSALFDEASAAGYLLHRPDGSVWQTDQWQAGMGVVDFTNPDATRWFQDKLRLLLAQGVDAFKTDFGERIPTDVVYADGSDPLRMHNLYAQRYNQAVVDVLAEVRGHGDAVVFARAATTGGQSLPVHWGGDSTSTYESMAESLRGGLSLAWSGFAFWSHDIGGFEGMPDAGVFKRWLQFGLLSSHSRLHASTTYRVPWAFDEESVEVARRFTELKLRLMPYLYGLGDLASSTGAPLLRPMAFEFPDDPTTAHLDRQYLLGPDLLVAPIFRGDGVVQFYLPGGTWHHLLTGAAVEGGRWRTETHDFLSLPLYVREGAVIPTGSRADRPDYDYLDGLELLVTPSSSARRRTVEVVTPDGARAEFAVEWDARGIHVTGPDGNWSVRVVGGEPVASVSGAAQLKS